MNLPTNSMDVPRLVWSPEDETVLPPERAHDDDSGYDVRVWSFVKMMTGSPMGVGEYEVKADEQGMIQGASVSPSEVVVNPGERLLVSTGFRATVQKPTWVPSWVEFDISICSRSGTPYKEGMVVANQPGTVDVSYRGPIMVTLANIGRQAFSVKNGDRVAQLVVRPVAILVLSKVETLPLPRTLRGDNGFGSSGKN